MKLKKRRIMKDLKFCQDLMDRLVKFAEEKYDCSGDVWQCNHTVIKKDIVRLRRELNEVRKKLEE